MNDVALFVMRYGLALQAAVGCVLAVRGVHVTLRDLRALNLSGQNGPKRLSTMLRVKVESFLLAVFVAMALVGFELLLVDDPAFLQAPFEDVARLVSRMGWNVVAALLITMQLMSHKGRASLDEYYDDMHRRSTDVDVQVSVAAQHDATRAQDHATQAQKVASSAQVAATLAQEAAIEASTDSTHDQATEA